MPNRKLTYSALAFSIVIIGIAITIMVLQLTYPGTQGPAGKNGLIGGLQLQPNMPRLSITKLETPLFTLIQPSIELIKNSDLSIISASFSMIASESFTINNIVSIPMFSLSSIFQPTSKNTEAIGVIFNPQNATNRHTLKCNVSLNPNCVFQIAEATLDVNPNDIFICHILYF